MIKSLRVKNFTVFREANFEFGKNLNVFVGENGAGKTHVLKLAYSILAAMRKGKQKPGAFQPNKESMQSLLADTLVGVFRPESLGRLATRQQGRQRCSVEITLEKQVWNTAFSFSTQSKSEVTIDQAPQAWIDQVPVFLPTRELLTIYPGFVSIYENHYLEFEETWRDTCVLLGALLKRGAKEKKIAELLAPLEKAMGGSLELDKNGRFYLKSDAGRMEMPLVAEGLRKLGMLARLIATGALLDKGCLFWDEPEANLNPRIIKDIAQAIIHLAKGGIQVFVATHSLFLMRELYILQGSQPSLDTRNFGLHLEEDGTVDVTPGSSLDDIGNIAALDEELLQSERYMAHEDQFGGAS